MAPGAWPWSDLAGQAAVIDRLAAFVERSERWRWLEVCCSLAAGRGDERSDVDAGIGYDGELSTEELEDAGLAAVHAAGNPTDVLVQVLPGWPADTRRFAVELDDDVQLDLVVLPAVRRTGLPTGALAVVDKDGRLAEPWQPPVEDQPNADVAREWLLLGWWALRDVAKHLGRGSLHEAVERLAEARQQALRLHATGEGTPFPSFGLVSLLDFPPYLLPDGIDATYALPTSRVAVLAAARATADLLDAAAARAGQRIGAPLATPWADTARRQLLAADRG